MSQRPIFFFKVLRFGGTVGTVGIERGGGGGGDRGW